MRERNGSIHDETSRRWRAGRYGYAVLLLAVLVTSACSLQNIRRHEQGVCDVPGSCGKCTRSYHYIAYKPPAYDALEKADYRWPLLLYLPGMLSIGEDVRRLAQDDPPGEIEAGRNFPMVVVTPMTPTFLEKYTPHVIASLIDHILARYRCDPDRVYLSGVSLSGSGVWDAIKVLPDRIAAAAIVCGWGSPEGIENAIDVPVWAFHGGIDFWVPPPFHYRMIEGMRKAGGNPRWTLVPLGTHEIWETVYRMPELYAWMLEQDLKHRGAGRGVAATAPDETPPPGAGSSALPPPRVVSLPPIPTTR